MNYNFRLFYFYAGESLPCSLSVWNAVAFLLFLMCVFRTEANPRLLVASEEGILYVYNVDTENGGQCELLKQYR